MLTQRSHQGRNVNTDFTHIAPSWVITEERGGGRGGGILWYFVFARDVRAEVLVWLRSAVTRPWDILCYLDLQLFP